MLHLTASTATLHHSSLARSLPPCCPKCPSPQRRVKPLLSSPRDDVTTNSIPASSQASTPAAVRATAGATDASGTPRVADSALPAPPSAAASRPGTVLLGSLQMRSRDPSTVNVYGKPYTKTELKAIDAAISHLSAHPRASVAAADGPEPLRRYLTAELLLDAAVFKRTPLPVVEGAMALVELLRDSSEPPAAAAEGDAAIDSPALMERYRWQLVVGADVGGVQYIPAVEELEVFLDGSDFTFTLGTDLDFIFTGFRGPCAWLGPGHLSYTVRQVRLELRWPKAWRRAAAWLAWRRRLGGAAATAAALGDEPDWGDSLPTSPTCREDPAAPALTVPLPFPTNELLAFSCDGRVAAIRSRLTGGLILLLAVDTRERLRRDGARAGSATGSAS